MSKTAFSDSVSSDNSPYTNSNLLVSQQLSFYTNLSNAITFLNTLIIQYSLGNFSYVSQTLSIEEYNNIAILFNSLMKDANAYPEYENIRGTINHFLQGLLQAVNQYNTILNVESELVICQKQASILTNMTELQEYINGLKTNFSAFPQINATVIVAKIKPEYVSYINLYGYPPNGVFEIDKLAPIIQGLV